MRFTAGVVVALAALACAAGEPPGREAVADALQREDVPALRHALAALAQAQSVDAAAETFAEAVASVPRNRRFRARFEAALAGGDAAATTAARSRYLFVLVPGWFYRSDPHTGADLAQPRAVLEGLGFATRLAALDENGAVEANGAVLAEELARLAESGRRVVLVSTSKGGPEAQLAVDRLERAGRARHLAAWFNIGGILNGTAHADRWTEWPRRWLAAIGFGLKGFGTESVASMTTAARRARFSELRVPRGMLVVNYIGVPLAVEVGARARDRYAVLADGGPNDGLTLLADAIVPQGITVAERGLDHFFDAPDLDRRIAAMAHTLIGALETSVVQ